MARLQYLDRVSVEFIAHKLAEVLFSGYPEPLPAFQLVADNGLALLESALGVTRQRYYPRLHDKAGVLLRSLIKNHALLDGNKRVGMTSTFVFLAMNHYILIASNREMVDFSLRIATEKPDVSWQECATWLKERTVRAKVPQEEIAAAIVRFPGELHDLRSISERLSEYGRALDAVKDQSQRS